MRRATIPLLLTASFLFAFVSLPVGAGLLAWAGNRTQQQSPDSLAAKPQDPAPPQPQAPTPQPQDQGKIIQVVNLVDVLFTVLNRRNKLVPDLAENDFKIWDDKSPQAIRYFSRQTDLPLRIGLLMDTSNSIRDRLKFEQVGHSPISFDVVAHNTDPASVRAA